jgi:hypothetical protein
VIHGSGGMVTSTRSTVDSSTTSFKILDKTGLAAGDSLVLTDGDVGRLVEVVTITPNGGEFDIGIVAPGTACPAIPMPSLSAGTLAVRSRVARFYVANLGGAPFLMMDPDGSGPDAAEPLAEGIEDFQIAIGVDLDDDGEVEEVGAAADDDEWFYNVVGDSAPPAITGGRWRSARITVVARELTTDGTTAMSSRPAAEDRAGGAADEYRRRALASQIEIRNLEVAP